MVPGEDTESAGVDLHALVDGVLGAEIRDMELLLSTRCGAGEPRLRPQVVPQRPLTRRQPIPESAVVGQHGPAGRIDRSDDPQRVAIDRPPERRIERLEEHRSLRVPTPVQIPGEALEPLADLAWMWGDRTTVASSFLGHGRVSNSGIGSRAVYPPPARRNALGGFDLRPRRRRRVT
jgi:hypothetical protein